ncbi:MAG: hypothetical protein ACI4MM_00285 [Candidatus Ventricola sp.]
MTHDQEGAVSFGGSSFFNELRDSQKDFTGKNRILNMNEFAFSCGIGSRGKTGSGYPQTCGKAVDMFLGFCRVFHIPKSSMFWLFGSYPGFPPHYGYSC